MVYSDLLFFLGLLPVSVLLSFFDRSTEYKNLILILTSLIFFSWGRPFVVCVMFLTVFAEWGIGLWIGKHDENGRTKTLALAIDIIMNAVVLVIAERKLLYLPDDAFGFAKIILPLSVGFYVLRGFMYVYDVYTGKINAEKNIFCLMTYMWAYFCLPSGVVGGYEKAAPLIRARKLGLSGISDGMTSFICGLSKAILLAPALKSIGDAGLNADKLSVIGCWLGTAAMAGYAYLLFTGFCDMSYGIGRIYGFDFERNYTDLTAKGIFGGAVKNTNIMLSSICSDIYTSITENRKALRIICVLILALLGGLWYRQSMAFAVAGIFTAVCILLEKSILRRFFENAPVILRCLLTVAAGIMLSVILFSTDRKHAGHIFAGLAAIGTKGIITSNFRTVFINNIFAFIAAFLLICTPLKKIIKTKVSEYSVKSTEKYGRISVLKTVLTALLLVLCIIAAAAANIKL